MEKKEYQDVMEKYARVVVEWGVNLIPNQMLLINSPVECVEFTRLLVKAGYERGAKNVIVKWNDGIINREYYLHVADDILNSVPKHVVDQYHYFVDNNVAVISISAPNPGLMADVDANRLQTAMRVSNQELKFYHDAVLTSKNQWCVISYPTLSWAEKVFPDMEVDKAYERLFDLIISSSRINGDADRNWREHTALLANYSAKLNDNDFVQLHFKNALGTDIKIGLADQHVWAGGSELTVDGRSFVPNIPTEEIFGMPHRLKVNGRVVSTKPLNFQGKLIEDFYLDFKDGKVIEFDAKKGRDVLNNLLTMDEGSSYIGEVALISHNTPISQSGVLFLNTLFDENASCHLALGSAYPVNTRGGESLSMEELIARGYNDSSVHVDFMFGSADMAIEGTKANGERVQIFSQGNFSI